MADWFDEFVDSAKSAGAYVSRELGEFGARLLDMPNDEGSGVTTDPGAHTQNVPGPEQRAPSNTAGNDPAVQGAAQGWSTAAMLSAAMVAAAVVYFGARS